MKPLIVIAGPTASGKTALSIELAKQINGEIICADSMQVYKYMNIGCATPTEKERQGISHHLFGIIDPRHNFSLAEYVNLAHEAIANVHQRGNMPILVGGTGLYIDTVVKNIKLIKTKSDPNYRRQLNMLADRFGTEYLHQMLMLVDPDEAGKLPSSDRRRIIRALEIYKTTGATKTEQNALSRFAPQIYKAVWFGIKMQRELLYERINMRVDKMMQEGLLAEVENLIKMGLDKNATAMQGIGYKELYSYFKGLYTLDEAIVQIKKRTRNYAKRQLTWFRKNKNMIWIQAGNTEEMLKICQKYIEKM